MTLCISVRPSLDKRMELVVKYLKVNIAMNGKSNNLLPLESLGHWLETQIVREL